MNERDSYLTNLPKVDVNNEIQRNSFSALNSFLPSDSFCLRDERIEDYGVDASLEILENRKATNFRTQIQLKGTRSLKPNKDESYSLQVDTNNLNYLLNAPISIYILYIEPKKEFRFVWASTEFQRLAEINPKWIEQGDITLRFTEILDLAKLDEIKEIIIRKGSFTRELNETLLLSKTSNVVLEINSETFEITDKEEILKLIINLGINLVNEGYHEEIIERINILDVNDKQNPDVVVVKSYAEYAFGRYRTAKDTIDFLRMRGLELSNDNQQLADWLESSCDYRLGNITFEERAKRIEKIAEKDDSEKFSSYRFDNIYCLLVDEKKSAKRNELIKELKREVEKLPKNELLKENVLSFKYRILEAELSTIIKEFSENLSNVSIRQNLNVYQNDVELVMDVAGLITKHNEKKKQWRKELNELFEETKNQVLKADILVENALLVISESSHIQFRSKVNKMPFEPIEDDLFELLKRWIEEAITIYVKYNLFERKLRAESKLAELMILKGQNDEANTIFADVSGNASRFNYAQVKANSENPLSKGLEKILQEANSIDFDEKQSNMTDEEVESYSQDILENLGIPENRLPNIKQDVFATRQVLKEKLYWCKNIELIQDLTHTESKETYYEKTPEQFGRCSKHNHKSIFGNSDYESVILAFKTAYCQSCPDRKPKKPQI